MLYTDQHGRALEAPDHKTAKYVAKRLLTPPQLADYMEGKFNLYVVDELGRKHHMMFGGALGAKG